MKAPPAGRPRRYFHAVPRGSPGWEGVGPEDPLTYPTKGHHCSLPDGRSSHQKSPKGNEQQTTHHPACRCKHASNSFPFPSHQNQKAKTPASDFEGLWKARIKCSPIESMGGAGRVVRPSHTACMVDMQNGIKQRSLLWGYGVASPRVHSCRVWCQLQAKQAVQAVQAGFSVQHALRGFSFPLAGSRVVVVFVPSLLFFTSPAVPNHS